ncbi:MAG: hypothetical protein H0T54_08150 [Geodermatophilaceae bacterium]|nr:hypothetical protein [Geodermatophilaceae bacterium]
MTSSVPHPAGGPDLAVLADLSAHLLAPLADRSARAHIDGCAECTSVLRALDRTGRELRWLPPIHMPAAVIDRIDSALAAESEIVSISHLRERRKRRQQLLGIAAAGLVVLGGGGMLVSQLADGSSGADVTAEIGTDTGSATASEGRDLDEESLPGAVTDLVTGGDGDQPLRLEGTPAPQDCVPSVQLRGSDQLIGVIEIRYGGRNRDAVFFTTNNPGQARVVVVEDCSVERPVTVATLKGEI